MATICTYILSEYISDSYVDGLSIISIKNLIMKSHQSLVICCKLTHKDITNRKDYGHKSFM